MPEIPPAKDTDAEDVVWGLQTAETLWKRGEKIDALVWLRRAAQAAGDANDDDRALELARHAAELTEWMATAVSSLPPSGAPAEPTSVDLVDDLPVVPTGPWAEADSALPPPRPQVATQPLYESEPAPPAGAPAVEEGPPSTISVPPAETVHAGMFDPWADQSSQMVARAPAPPPQALPPPPLSVVPSLADADEEVVTSVRPLAAARSEAPPVVSPVPAPAIPVAPRPPRPSRSNLPSPPKPAAKPPPLPPRARPHAPKPASPASVRPAAAPEPVETRPPTATPDVGVSPVAPVHTAAPAPPTPAPPAAPDGDSSTPATSALELESVEAFADLPDDARSAFAVAATLHSLAEGEEIGTFALAYVVSGSFDVAATMVDAPAVRLGSGSVLRARGTTEDGVPMRLICAKGNGVVATWSDSSVDEAFRTIPWVEEDLRAAADKVQTLVGITIGPLGERLDVSIREEIVSRLTMRPLGPSEVVVEAGEPVPGLLLVGVGELELVEGDNVAGVVGSGEFLFPTEVLGAGSAPVTARAGPGGALVMFGDRRIAQELLVTCPPLLEVFAGM